MKKSKFLKRSLSLLLALMMLMALIPSGAFAAAAPTLQALYVGSEQAPVTISGKTLSVSIDPANNYAQTKLTYYAKDNKGLLYFGNPQKEITSGDSYNIKDFADANGVATVPLVLVDPANPVNRTEYTLVVQTKTADASVRIEDFYIDNQLSSTFKPGDLAFEVVMPYNTDLAGNGANTDIVAHVKLEQESADHDWNKNNGVNGDSVQTTVDYNLKAAIMTVTAENGDMTQYTITIRRAEALSSFTFDEVVDYEIEQPVSFGTQAIPPFTTEKVAYGGEVNVLIPKNSVNGDANYLTKIIPSFDGELSAAKYELYNTVTEKFTTITSDVTEVDLTAACTNPVKPGRMFVVVTYPENGGAKAVYELDIKEETTSTQTVINGFTVINGNNTAMSTEGDVDGTDLKATVNSAYQRDKVTLEFKVSFGAKISVNGGPQVSGAGNALQYDTLTIGNVDVRKAVVLTVESENGDLQTYTLNVETNKDDEPAEAKFSSMILKNLETGDEYKAYEEDNGLAGVYIKFKVPASTTIADLQDFNLYYSAPLGAELKYKTAGGEANLPRSGATMALRVGPNLVLPNPQPDILSGVAHPFNTEIIVRTYGSNVNKKNETKYIVEFELEAPKMGNTLISGDFTLTKARATSEINSDTTYTAVVGEEFKTGVGDVATLEISIPYNDFNNINAANPDRMEALNVAALKLPEGAALYIQDPATPGRAVRYYPSDSKKWSANPAINITNGDWAYYEDVDTTGRVFVANEIGIMDCMLGGNKDILDVSKADLSANLANVKPYYLLITEKAARETVSLSSISLIDEYDREVKGTISNGIISFNVPFSWANGVKTPAPATGKKMWFKFEASPGNYVQSASSLVHLNGGYRKVDGTQEDLANGNDYFLITKAGVGIGVGFGLVATETNQLLVLSESGLSQKTFGLDIKVNPVQTGAELKSFSLNGATGTIGNNTVEVVLPYMTDVSSLTPVFTVSDMATMKFDNTGAEVVSEKTPLDFTDTVNVTVTSEDGKNSTRYAIKVSRPMSFSDVQDKSQWYYDWVYKIAELGFVTGYPDGTFRPLEDISRGQFMLFLARTSGLTDKQLAEKYTESPFIDVEIEKYYAPAIAWGYEQGYIDGFGESNFKPEQKMTREQVAKVMCVVLGLSEVTDPAELRADHNAISPWAKGYVYAVLKNGIMDGVENNKFAPTKVMNRAQVAKLMVSYYDVK